ncbi:anhydro-N-acetylmuramic acid kinase [Ningiella sp. W23]|uniref:anhydro-N-acetylmuramic acid kinase n=1 Tax=Ningiella sp. W23 TaxID=3023715 RepID=UPI0037584CAD
MHRDILKLNEIAAKPSRMVLGLMSGTSLDGLDIALCEISGHGTQTSCELLNFLTLEYEQDYRDKVKEVFAKQHASIEHLCLMNAWIARQHAKMVNEALDQFTVDRVDVDFIASHGQTIYHSPRVQHGLEEFPNATLQIGDGDHIAHLTGIITLSDFRQKHIAAGGQGAPLVMYGDYLLFKSDTENRILLNLGGIANLSLLPKDSRASILSSDLGPGNTMMDAYVQQYFAPATFDSDAQIASKGKVSEPLLAALLDNVFFNLGMPKTTGPELFNLQYLDSAISSAKLQLGNSELTHEDVMATLCEFTAVCVANSICSLAEDLRTVSVYSSGGGVHNPLLMQRIETLVKSGLPAVKFSSTADLSVPPDAKEAVLFALLANETISGEAIDFPASSTSMPNISMGKVSFPR